MSLLQSQQNSLNLPGTMDKQSEIPFLCQNLAKNVFILLDASFS